MKVEAENLLIEPALSGGSMIRFETMDVKWSQDLLHKYDGKKVTVEIKEQKHKRSLDANAYCWVLCDKIASTKGLLISKGDVYKQAIRNYGVSNVVMIETDKLYKVLNAWDSQGYGNSHDIIGESKQHPEYTFVRLYLGSSTYDTHEMSVFLDGIIADAEELGIETLTPSKLAELKALWGDVNG